MKNLLYGALICSVGIGELSGQLFSPARELTASNNEPRKIVSADIDEDGDLDLVVVSLTDDKVAWLENEGSGPTHTWRQHIISTNADGANGLAVADLDGDGDLDVLSASRIDDKIAWYENFGLGEFGSEILISTNADVANSVFAADLDGDGDEDVLSASEGDDKIAWYENDGSGAFGPEQLISTSANQAKCVYSADIDDDGDMDVMSASYQDDKIAWYENDGSGLFGTEQILSPNVNRAGFVIAHDVDGDGDLDLVSSAVTQPGPIMWYENVGAGVFNNGVSVSGMHRSTAGVHCADIDLDGDQDIVTSFTFDDQVVWFENTAAGFSSTPHIILESFEIEASAVADIDGDGQTDVISSDYRGIFMHPVDGTPGLGPIHRLSGSGTNSPIAADLDADGYTDVVVGGNRAGWFRNEGNLTFEPKRLISVESCSAVDCGDLDGDGDLDMFYVHSILGNSSLYWHANDGSGIFGAKQLIDSVGAAGAAKLHDLDSDGDIDIVVGDNDEDRLIWYENDGAATFSEPIEIFSNSFFSANSLDCADFDADGNQDIVVGSGQLRRFRNQGNQTFSSSTIVPDEGYNAYSVQFADMDDDTDLDILSSFLTGDIEWTEQNNLNSGSFNTDHHIDNAAHWIWSAYAADIDADGHLDIVSADYDAGSVFWYPNDGMGNFSQKLVVDSIDSQFPNQLLAHDFDGDGDTDVILTTRTTNKVVIYRNLTTSCGGDITGDGIIDIDDFLQFASVFDTVCSDCPEDLNGDGLVSIDDFLILNSIFGSTCP